MTLLTWFARSLEPTRPTSSIPLMRPSTTPGAGRRRVPTGPCWSPARSRWWEKPWRLRPGKGGCDEFRTRHTGPPAAFGDREPALDRAGARCPPGVLRHDDRL